MQLIKKEIEQELNFKDLKSFESVYHSNKQSQIKKWFYGILFVLIGLLLLPWTQNIRAKGLVTTLRQEQRPQEINTVIAGKIIKWYVKEGDFVRKGDTIAQLAEIKDNYLDPNLIDRTQEQIKAKSEAIASYGLKANASVSQINALQEAKSLKILQIKNKINQLRLKIISDSMDVIAVTNDFKIAEAQYNRQKVMRDSGLVSTLQLEQRNQAYQTNMSKKIGTEIKFTNTKTDYINAQIELKQIEQEYAEKVYKAQGEKASALSDLATGQGELSKISNQYANYIIRSGQYFLIAPQSGQIVHASKAGINEIVKEGEKLLEIVPQDVDYAIEMFVKPVDLPLLSIGQKVRFLFDGFPAIVFSGWPRASYGTFGGEIRAIESSVSPNGKFRILVGEDTTENKPWPKSLKMGTGASGIALLKNVPIWYELWRNINGFPPDYYQPKVKKDEKK